jgi:hypothetical protein
MTHPHIEQASHALVTEVQRQTTSKQAFYDPEGDFHLSATEMVRVVLLTLREPDSAMIEAAVFEISPDPRITAHRMWQAMIDTMLEA